MPQCTSATFSPVERAGPLSDMLGQTRRRRQSAGGAGDSARMQPRSAQYNKFDGFGWTTGTVSSTCLGIVPVESDL
jgi:hypothetical protein